MMQEFGWAFAALFLPLFPFAMGFNAIFQRSKNVWLRLAIILIWPMPGIWIVQSLSFTAPNWVIYWSLFSALLYGLRAVVVKEFGVWVGFLASSAWATSWIMIVAGASNKELWLHVLAFSFPLAVLVVLVSELEKRYLTAYVSIIGGLAQAQPKLAILFVIALLAAIGSPIFPAFFSMIATIAHSVSALPIAAFGLVLLWLLWGWSGIGLLQQLLVGTNPQVQYRDLSQGALAIYGASLLLLVIGGLYLSRIVL